MAKDTALVPVPTEGLYLAQYIGRMDELKTAIRDNFGDGGIAPRELPRIRIPAGGGKAWELPTLEGGDMTQRIECNIVHFKTMRAYWTEPFGSGDAGSPPSCTSDDGVFGVGYPGVACKRCEFNQFNTAPKAGGGVGRGKACREVLALFVITTDTQLPYFMPMPPMSIQPVRQYLTMLTQRGMSYWQAETAFELVQNKSRDGIQYSQSAPKFVRALTPAEADRIREYREYIQPAIDGTRLERTDVYDE